MEEIIKYDVVVIGSGMAGSIISAILARHNVSVLLIDKNQHPKFAIGESTIPGTSNLLRIMADRFDVPELGQCSTFFGLRQNVTSSSGIKRNFSFVYHEKGKLFNPKQSNMLTVPHYPHGPESHLFRQDIDAFLHNTAIKYGAESLTQVQINSIEEVDDGMLVKINNGKEVHAKYIVDGSGHQSLLAKKYGLREVPTRLATHSRSIFTHMVGVKHFDNFYDKNDHGLPQPLSQGTLHHLFDGGWLWVIPFNNYESSNNNLCSIGLQLDPRKYPLDGRSPEQEFNDFLDDYPEIKQQFTEAKEVRPWVSAPRLQFSSSQVVGGRFCLMAHAAGFVDPLFSRGLYITMETINALSQSLIDAVHNDDFSEEQFSHMERLTQGLIESHDKVVNASFISFEDYDIWNAWYRVWALGGTISSLKLRTAHIKYKETKDIQYLNQVQNHKFIGSLSSDLEEYHELFNAAYKLMLNFESKEITKDQVINGLYQLYENKSWIPPMYKLNDSKVRYISKGDLKSFLVSNIWGYLFSPGIIREKYFKIKVSSIFFGVTKVISMEREWFSSIKKASKYATFKFAKKEISNEHV